MGRGAGTGARKGVAAVSVRFPGLVLPEDVTQVLGALHQAGHEAYVVGGCVRDTLLGRQPKDWDITTSARPEETQSVFPNGVYTNAFGTVIVPMPSGPIEVTTYRIDGDYADHRRPEGVTFTSRLVDDLARRDFTINAMAYADGNLIDPFGGAMDLDRRVLRTVGLASERFAEDALRMLRAARFVAQLELTATPEVVGAIADRREDLRAVSAERIGAELEKMLACAKPSGGLRLLAKTRALEVVFPALAATIGVVQTKKRGFDVFEHTLMTIDAADASHRILRWAALCHDLGKPATKAGGHFIGHDLEGARITVRALRAIKMDERSIEAVRHLVRHHMFWFQGEWTGAAVRRFINKVGLEQVPTLLELRKADVKGGGKQNSRFPALTELEQRIQAEIDAQSAFSLRDMRYNGTQIMEQLGIRPGREVGYILNALFERVLDDPLVNQPERLRELTEDLHQQFLAEKSAADAARAKRQAAAVAAPDRDAT